MKMTTIRNILILCAVPLFMANNCTLTTGHIQIKYPLNSCPPKEFAFPVYSENSEYLAEIVDLLQNKCKGVTRYKITDKKRSDSAEFYLRLKNNKNRCELHVVFESIFRWLYVSKNLKGADNYQKSMALINSLPKMLLQNSKFKVVGKPVYSEKEIKMTTTDIEKWCTNYLKTEEEIKESSQPAEKLSDDVYL